MQYSSIWAFEKVDSNKHNGFLNFFKTPYTFRQAYVGLWIHHISSMAF